MKKLLIGLTLVVGLGSQAQQKSLDTLIMVEDKFHKPLKVLLFKDRDKLTPTMDSIYYSDPKKYEYLHVNFIVRKGDSVKNVEKLFKWIPQQPKIEKLQRI